MTYIFCACMAVGARPGQGYTSSKGHCGQVTVVVKPKIRLNCDRDSPTKPVSSH